MPKLVTSLAAFLVSAAAMTACSGDTKPADDSSSHLFGATVDGYGQKLSQDDQDALAVARALRGVDACGFVDDATLNSTVPDADFYTYSGSPMTCLISRSGGDSPMGKQIRLDIRTDVEPDWDKHPANWNDLQVGNVLVKSNADCNFFFPLGLGDLEGAPKSSSASAALDREYVAITAGAQSDAGCELTKAVATSAAKIKDTRLPRLDAKNKLGTELFDKDPCSLSPDLKAFNGFIPNIGDGTSCAFRPSSGDSLTYVVFALSKRATLNGSWKTEQRDGVTLYIEPGYQEGNYHDCRIAVVAGQPVSPTIIGTASDSPKAKNQDLWPLPVIDVTGQDCEQNKQIAVAAAKKFA
ncbi:hypothetical protein [Mycobacterium sp. NPDC050853]|uniref:hypothetical protein n=1 Tax=Mycobacterium sp. NPDC050853 TaxID=3155160 RepID=UPI0033F7816D